VRRPATHRHGDQLLMTTPAIPAHRLALRTPASTCASTPGYSVFRALRISPDRLPLLRIRLFTGSHRTTNNNLPDQQLFSPTRKAIQYP
jgi:hypothetical protein